MYMNSGNECFQKGRIILLIARICEGVEFPCLAQNIKSHVQLSVYVKDSTSNSWCRLITKSQSCRFFVSYFFSCHCICAPQSRNQHPQPIDNPTETTTDNGCTNEQTCMHQDRSNQ